MRQNCKTKLIPLGLLTGQNTPKSNFLRQENLTKLPFSLENRDTYKKLSKMGKIDKGAALGTMMLGALAANPALAEDQRPSIQLANMTDGQIEDCVGFVKEQRTLAADNGVAMSRKDQKLLLLDCRGGKLDARIVEQEKILATLDEEIRHLDLKLDEQAQILDDQGRVLAKITTINGKLIIRKQELIVELAQLDGDIEKSRARQDELLQQAEIVLDRISKHLAAHS